MKLFYDVQDKPKFGKVIVFALQQLLAIMAATIAVPMIISGTYGCGDVKMSTVAALLGAGFGTIVYVLFTKAKSPVFLGSSFAFLGSMAAAFAGAATVELGFAGLILGAIFAGLVYVILAIIVKCVGVNWVNKLMPPIIIGPTVAIIGLSLAGNAIGDFQKGAYYVDGAPSANFFVCIICGFVTLFVTVISSIYGKKMIKLIPFIMGIVAGYAVAGIFTFIGFQTGNDALKVLDLSGFQALVANGVNLNTFFAVPEFTFVNAFGGFGQISTGYVISVLVAYAPVALVVFAEHIADHKNISSIIERDLLKEPGLHRTLLGDGVGSMVGAVFGGAPNTTYGESVACVALSGNASVVTIITTAIMAIVVAFINPFSVFLASIPPCVMGGVCTLLYGWIAVSGLKMIQGVDLGDNRNLYVISSILIFGIGGFAVSFTTSLGAIKITTIACALIVGILVNLVLKPSDKKKSEDK